MLNSRKTTNKILKTCRCCSQETKKIFCDKFVEIYECINCRTIMIDHLGIKGKYVDEDYYSNKFYNQKFLEKSLVLTRKRQSLKILGIISKFTKKNTELIDFGFGRGVFLREANKFGYHKLIGIESSKKAIDNTETFFKKVLVEFNKNKLIFSGNIIDEHNYDERIFVALDIIGLFKILNLNIWLEDVLKKSLNPKYLIIKIPNRDGLLFNFAYFLAKFKITNKFLHQLLQVGTYPPHYFYFSKKGLLNLFSKLNYRLIYECNDLDYEISSFGSRLNAKGIKKVFFNLAIPLLSLITKISNSHDSKILFFSYK